MDHDEILYMNNAKQSADWLAKLRACRPDLPAWVSSFHPQQQPCRLLHETDEHDRSRSYNWIVQFVFEDGEEWIVRFLKGSSVRHPDEKVEAEVVTMKLVRDRTGIPVPEVKAWGLAAENRLGLGPFIMMAVIRGIDLESILRNPDSKDRLMREDVSDAVVATIYRQVARYVLQLFKLDFPRIGSLSKDSTLRKDGGEYAAAIDSRPFTWRAHEALVLGGVDTYCAKDTTFSSTTDYFTHVARADLQQLHQQVSSVDDEADARAKYDHGPYKLICDDFGPANMIVDNEQDLKIIGVIDWEWSYVGPSQLFCSPPHWLLLDAPNYWFEDDDEVLTRYEKALEMFLGILEEEEGAILGDGVAPAERPSAVMRACKEDGRMWFHCIMRQGFNGPDMLVWERLRDATPDFQRLVEAIPEEEITAFVEGKMDKLAKYKVERDKTQEWFDEMLSGKSKS